MQNLEKYFIGKNSIFDHWKKYDYKGELLEARLDSNFVFSNQASFTYSKRYDATKKAYVLSKSTSFYSFLNSKKCEDSTRYIVMEGKDTISWITTNKSDFEANTCLPLKREKVVWDNLKKRITFHGVEKITAKNNWKDIFTRFSTPITDCDYGAIDSTHEIFFMTQNGTKQIETWYRDSSYEANFFSDKNLPFKKLLLFPNNFSTQSFYHYDKYNNLETEEIYRMINGKIDSTTRRILKKSYIIYDVGGRMLYGKFTDYEQGYSSYETFNKYNCNSILVESKTVGKYSISINSYTYYDDNCDKSTVIDMNFSIYPNPTSDKIKIKTGIGLTFDKIEIYNPLGVLMKETEIDECDIEVEMDVKDLNQGLYYLKISSKEGEQRFASKPFMKVN